MGAHLSDSSHSPLLLLLRERTLLLLLLRERTLCQTASFLFLLRLAIARRHYPPKRLLDINRAGLELSPPLPPAYIFKLLKGSAPRFHRPAAGEAARELGKSLVAGWGVPQMAEYFLRLSPSDILAKAKILGSRVQAARALAAKARFWLFETGPDPAGNAAALKAFLRSGSAPA